MQGSHFRHVLILVSAGLFTTPAPAELRTTTPSHDLGLVRGGQKVTQAFELVNVGQLAIEIIEVERGCGCLAVRLDRNRFEPGERGLLAAELRTLGQADGPHAWRMSVRYRAGSEVKTLSLVLQGVVQNDVLVQPAIIGLHVTGSVQQEITITDRRAKPLRVVDVDVRMPGVRVERIERSEKTTKVLFTADAALLLAGRQEGRVTITTDDGDYDQFTIPLVVTKAMPMRVTAVPGEVELRPGAAALVRLRSTTRHPVRVARIETSDAALSCTWAAGPGDDATLRLRYAGGETGAAQVRVHLDGPGGDSITIPVTILRE